MDINKQIAETLASLDNIKCAEANPFLYQETIGRLKKHELKIISLNSKISWAVAASVALLIVLNVFTAARFTKSENTQQKTATAFAKEYFSYINTLQF